nr:hypothetical protein [Tanacetum cinerariifolium]GEW60154.1 hypothetical protein [Tanacetum cinerariifolium]
MATNDKESSAAVAFMANLTGTSTGEGTSNDIDFHSEVHTHNNHSFEYVNHQVTQEMHQEEQVDSDVDSDIDDYDNITPYHQYQSNTKVKNVPTGVSTVVPDQISVITILDDLRSQLAGHIKTNEEQSLANVSLKAEIERYKTRVLNLEQCKDLHKTALGRSNPKYLKAAQLSRPTLYIGDVVVIPLHIPHRVHDNEDTLVHAEVSRTKMLAKMKNPDCPIISSPINYANFNNLYDTFVPQKELTREQAYWLPANEVTSNQSKPAQQFVRTRPAKIKRTAAREDNIIRKLKAHINNMKDVSTGPCLSTLEIENTQLKEELTAVRIKNDSLRNENVSIKARFQELYKSKAGSNSSVSSGATIPVKPKAVASGLYVMTPKYVPP